VSTYKLFSNKHIYYIDVFIRYLFIIIILRIMVRYRILSSTTTEWRTLRVGGLSAEVTSLTLHQLRPETVYEFTVLARNRLGDGLFSDITTARTKSKCSNAAGDVVRLNVKVA